MLYNYKSEEYIQDVILHDYDILINDIIDEYSTLRRYQALYIYAPSDIASEIVNRLFTTLDELQLFEEAHEELLLCKDEDVLITIDNEGLVFIEEAKYNGKFKISDGTGALNYVYDSFKKSDIDELALEEDSVLVFGFEE